MSCPARCGDNPTRWLILRVEGPPGKHAISYRCRTCGHQRLQLGGIQDIQQAVESVSATYQRSRGVSYIDEEDFAAYLTAEAWGLWLKWKPDKGVPFGAYLFRFLPLRANQYYRSSLGRNGHKTLVPVGDATDLTRVGQPGDHQLAGAVTASQGHAPVDSSASLLGLHTG